MNIKRLLCLILPCLFLAACDLEYSNNGMLDGNWQLRQIDTLATNGTCNMSQSYIYWAVQDKLLQIRDIDNDNLIILFRFEKKEGHLTILSPCKVITKDELVPLETNELLLPFGITDIEETFLIENLSHGNLVLSNDLYRLHFRKY